MATTRTTTEEVLKPAGVLPVALGTVTLIDDKEPTFQHHPSYSGGPEDGCGVRHGRLTLTQMKAAVAVMESITHEV